MIEEKSDYGMVGWEELQDFTKILATKLKESKYDPNIIVGISKGGWAISRLLCDYIDGKDIISSDAKHWEIYGQDILSSLNMNLSEKKVLMVYDIIDEKSMERAIEYLSSLKPNNIKILALFYVKGKMKPDYYAEEILNKLVIFPWNLVDRARKIIYGNLDKFGKMNAISIKSMLNQSLNLDLEEEIIEEILKEYEKPSNEK